MVADPVYTVTISYLPTTCQAIVPTNSGTISDAIVEFRQGGTTGSGGGSGGVCSGCGGSGGHHHHRHATTSLHRASSAARYKPESCERLPALGGGGGGNYGTTSTPSKATNKNGQQHHHHHHHHQIITNYNSIMKNSSLTSKPEPSLPMTPAEALKLYGSSLTEYERHEIQNYSQVWYLGINASKIHGDEDASQNAGYDDENGNYIKVMHDHLAFRYEILEVIGKGSFGQVIRALDHRTHQQVAIKIIRNKKRFHQQALVEVRILDHLRRKDQDNLHHIVHMNHYFYFRNHLCISFELMSLNLYELVKKNNYQGFTLDLVRRFALSLVNCLKLLQQENIIHCDLKPENVLLKQRGSSAIKVIDFGSSCFAHERVYTYIQSRFYRAPEVLLGLPYGPAIDMWSLGCVLAELSSGSPLFPGENEVDQLACLMELLGVPPSELIANASRRRLYFDSRGNPRSVTNSKGQKRRPGSRDLSHALRTSDPVFNDFIAKCLEWDSTKRLTPDKAQRHEWLAQSTATTPEIAASPASVKDLQQHYSLYRLYKGKKALAAGDADVVEKLRTSTKQQAVSSRAAPSRSMCGLADLDSSLDDSGTFLPPIL